VAFALAVQVRMTCAFPAVAIKPVGMVGTAVPVGFEPLPPGLGLVLLAVPAQPLRTRASRVQRERKMGRSAPPLFFAQ
jgi:hypothetical protein